VTPLRRSNQSEENSALDLPIFPKIVINRQIRSPKGPRISRFICSLGQNLKTQITALTPFGVPLAAGLLLSVDQTTTLADYADSLGDGENNKRPGAIVYVRVSGDEQARDGISLDTQEEKLRSLADDEDLRLPYDTIRDEGETGRDFDREGIQRVFRLAQRDEIEYLLVDDVDRIGRVAAETLYFLHVLQKECDVTLLTPAGSKDISGHEGLLSTTLMSLMAQIQNDIRIRKATENRLAGFIEKKNWCSYKTVVPLGYDELDNGWISINADDAEVVRDMFDTFLKEETYAGTRRYLKGEYGEEVLEGHRVKTLLTEHAYVGRPQVPDGVAEDYSGRRVLDEPELQIVGEETFEEVQYLIEQKNQPDNDAETNGVVDFLKKFDIFSIVECSEIVTLLCEVCGAEMTKNGRTTVSGNIDIKTHYYVCPECGKNRKWPRKDEYERMAIINKILNGKFRHLLDD